MTNDYKNEFKSYLIAQGFKEYSASGNRSTAIDYQFRILKIKEQENMTWKELASNIDTVFSKYNKTGLRSDYGKRSHESYINSIKHYSKFIKSQPVSTEETGSI